MTLADTVETVVGDWIRWSIADRAPELAMTAEADRAVAQGSAAISTELRRLLAGDIADQGEAPQPTPAPTHPVLEHPAVQAALDIFGGTVETIDEREG